MIIIKEIINKSCFAFILSSKNILKSYNIKTFFFLICCLNSVQLSLVFEPGSKIISIKIKTDKVL